MISDDITGTEAKKADTPVKTYMTADGQGKEVQKDHLQLDVINWEGANEYSQIISKIPKVITEGLGDQEKVKYLPNLDADIEENKVSPGESQTKYQVKVDQALTAEETEIT